MHSIRTAQAQRAAHGVLALWVSGKFLSLTIVANADARADPCGWPLSHIPGRLHFWWLRSFARMSDCRCGLLTRRCACLRPAFSDSAPGKPHDRSILTMIFVRFINRPAGDAPHSRP